MMLKSHLSFNIACTPRSLLVGNLVGANAGWLDVSLYHFVSNIM